MFLVGLLLGITEGPDDGIALGPDDGTLNGTPLDNVDGILLGADDGFQRWQHTWCY